MGKIVRLDSKLWHGYLKNYLTFGRKGYHNFAQTNSLFVAALLAFHNIQLVAIISMEIVSEHLKSCFHVSVTKHNLPPLRQFGEKKDADSPFLR